MPQSERDSDGAQDFFVEQGFHDFVRLTTRLRGANEAQHGLRPNGRLAMRHLIQHGQPQEELSRPTRFMRSGLPIGHWVQEVLPP